MSTGAYISATIDLGDVEKGLAAMERPGVLGPAFKDLKRPLRLDQKDHSKKRQGPESSWAPRAASTMERMRMGGHRAKKPLGRLTGAVSYSADATGVRGWSRVSWSDVFQTGGVVGKGVRLPARPFLWVSDEMLRIAENTIGSALVRAYGGN
jgi:phage gpG-like protein